MHPSALSSLSRYKLDRLIRAFVGRNVWLLISLSFYFRDCFKCFDHCSLIPLWKPQISPKDSLFYALELCRLLGFCFSWRTISQFSFQSCPVTLGDLSGKEMTLPVLLFQHCWLMVQVNKMEVECLRESRQMLPQLPYPGTLHMQLHLIPLFRRPWVQHSRHCHAFVRDEINF